MATVPPRIFRSTDGRLSASGWIALCLMLAVIAGLAWRGVALPPF